jgi:transposase
MEKTDYIGIDVSHLTLDICRSDGSKKELSKIPNTVASIKEWIDTLPSNAHCVFEATGIYSHKLEYWLGQKGMGCTKLNPNKIKGFMMASGSLHKNDQHDARLIQRYGETFQVKNDKAVEAEQIQKDRCVQQLAYLKKMLQSIDNQIHVIKQEAIFMDILIEGCLQMKQTIEQQILDVEQMLSQLRPAQQVDQMALLRSIPGIGKRSAQAIIDAIGSFDYFDNDKQLVRFLGVAPVSATSGTSVKRMLGICGTAVPEVRSCLYMAVTAAIKSNPSCGDLHLRLRQKGKPKKVARLAVVNKLIRQSFAIVKSGKPFEPNFEEKRQAEHMQKTQNNPECKN